MPAHRVGQARCAIVSALVKDFAASSALYEGSGEAKRLLDWLADDACEALWALKQLRNVWLRHDPAHGDDAAQSKKWDKLRQALEYLGVSALPTDGVACHALYDALLSSLGAMLTALHLGITAKG